MITVIDQPTMNLYEGMSFSETLDNMVIGVCEACNDFMMDCLLTEHAYLYENATEITYVNEDGSNNANGASLKEKFFKHVEAVKKMIGDAIKRVLGFISKKVDAIHDKLIALGINEKKILLDVLVKALRDGENKVNNENGQKLDDAAEKHAKQSFEGDAKSDKAEYLKFLEAYREKNQYELIDPLKIREKIKDLGEEIAKFEAGVDTAIQIANATHDITIEY